MRTMGASYDGNPNQSEKAPDEETGGGDPITGLSQSMIFKPKWEAPCSLFFQEKASIDFQSYLNLKREEKNAVLKFKAAVKIQARWRGFLTRYNLTLLHGAATKIQAFARGMLARRKYAALLQEMAEIRRLKIQNAAATKIQAAWRGFSSRKNKLNFSQYKKIQEKNKSLKSSIDKINELESALVTEFSGSSSSDSLKNQNVSSYSSNEDLEGEGSVESFTPPFQAKSIENLISENFGELAANMSDSRVAELYTYATNKTKKGWDGKEISRSVGKKSPKLKLRVDSVDDLFPEFPNFQGLIRPDSLKVESLKKAIRLLHNQIKNRELEKKQKLHYLLRTSVVPGVYSDIYCHELTDFEKELKSLKFWNPPPPKSTKKNKETRNDDESEWELNNRPHSPINSPASEDYYEGKNEEEDILKRNNQF